MCLRDGGPRLHLRLKNPVPGVSLLRSRKRKLLSSLGFSAENGRSLALSFPSPPHNILPARFNQCDAFPSV